MAVLFVLARSLAQLQNEVNEVNLQVQLLQHNYDLLNDIKKGQYNTMGVLFPLEDVTAKITSYFGSRTAPTKGASTYHQGIDISVPVGTNVNAATNGVVTETGYNGTSGNYVVIDNGSGIETAYRHLRQIYVKKGDVVRAGQLIALSGNTGLSTGPHLHFETKVNGEYVDPLTLILNDNGEMSATMTGQNQKASAGSALRNYWPVLLGGLAAFALIAPRKREE